MEEVEKLLKILIVDDEVSQRTGLAGMVNAWGMAAETASEGGEAMEKVASFSPDVIVTDLNMPGMDGYHFLEKLQEQGEAPRGVALGQRDAGGPQRRAGGRVPLPQRPVGERHPEHLAAVAVGDVDDRRGRVVDQSHPLAGVRVVQPHGAVGVRVRRARTPRRRRS